MRLLLPVVTWFSALGINQSRMRSGYWNMTYEPGRAACMNGQRFFGGNRSKQNQATGLVEHSLEVEVEASPALRGLLLTGRRVGLIGLPVSPVYHHTTPPS